MREISNNGVHVMEVIQREVIVMWLTDNYSNEGGSDSDCAWW